MGQKINPIGLRLGINRRPHKTCRITIYTARPGVVIGKKGADIEVLQRNAYGC